LTGKPSGATVEPFDSAEPEFLRLEPLSDGFRIGRPRSEDLLVQRDPGGWSVTWSGLPEWRLERTGQPGSGFLLLAAATEGELGRSTALDPEGFLGGIRYLVVADGRMFRMAPAPPRQTGFELAGWETAGAYMIARPEPSEWSIESTPAAAGMKGIGPVLILFAAEILDQDSVL